MESGAGPKPAQQVEALRAGELKKAGKQQGEGAKGRSRRRRWRLVKVY